MILAGSLIAAFLAGALAYRTWHCVRERRRERKFLENAAKIYGLVSSAIESNEVLRGRLTSFLRGS